MINGLGAKLGSLSFMEFPSETVKDMQHIQLTIKELTEGLQTACFTELEVRTRTLTPSSARNNARWSSLRRSSRNRI